MASIKTAKAAGTTNQTNKSSGGGPAGMSPSPSPSKEVVIKEKEGWDDNLAPSPQPNLLQPKSPKGDILIGQGKSESPKNLSPHVEKNEGEEEEEEVEEGAAEGED